MADENVMEELPTQSNISAEEERDEDDPEPDSTTQPSSDHIGEKINFRQLTVVTTTCMF